MTRKAKKQKAKGRKPKPPAPEDVAAVGRLSRQEQEFQAVLFDLNRLRFWYAHVLGVLPPGRIVGR